MSCFSCFSSQDKRVMRRSQSHGAKEYPSTPPPPRPNPHYSPQRKPVHPPQSPAIKNKDGHNNNNNDDNNNSNNDNKEGSGNKDIAAQTFTFRELTTATRNFRKESLIGQGGFGRVYKGKLEKTGQIVAVKQLDRNGMQGNREFLVEVLMLSLLNHENLVNFSGYCVDGDQRLLVYEYMPLGTLDDHLLDLAPGRKPLDWYKRMKIALGTAKGLEYLHDKANPPVIHRDLKSSNILLDNEFTAKLSDFGLAKLGPVGDNTHVSSRVMGTYGYCAPEYQRTGQLTVKSDVYSFGVVLLELITGRRAIDPTRPTREENLVSWAEPIFKEPSNFSKLADPLLEGNYPVKGLNQAVAAAAMCLQDEAPVRPYISDVVTALSFLGSRPGSMSLLTSPSDHQDAETMSSAAIYDQGSNASARQKAVAEAMESGSHNSRTTTPRCASTSSV